MTKTEGMLYQHQLRNALLTLNPGRKESVDRLIKITDSLISQCKKYFPDDYLPMMKEITKPSVDFESFFRVIITYSDPEKNPVDLFLPAALYDICTDNKQDVIGQTQQKLIEKLEHVEKNPELHALYTLWQLYGVNSVNLRAASSKRRVAHDLNTGNKLIAFLASYIALEEAVMPSAPLAGAAEETVPPVEPTRVRFDIPSAQTPSSRSP